MADSRLRGYRAQHPHTGNSTCKDAEAVARQALESTAPVLAGTPGQGQNIPSRIVNWYQGHRGPG